MRACMAGAAPAECAAREWGAAQQLVKGLYALPLAAWLAAYPRGALLVLTLEELRRGRPARVSGFHGLRVDLPARRAARADAGGGQAQAPCRTPWPPSSKASQACSHAQGAACAGCHWRSPGAFPTQGP